MAIRAALELADYVVTEAIYLEPPAKVGLALRWVAGTSPAMTAVGECGSVDRRNICGLEPGIADDRKLQLCPNCHCRACPGNLCKIKLKQSKMS